MSCHMFEATPSPALRDSACPAGASVSTIPSGLPGVGRNGLLLVVEEDCALFSTEGFARHMRLAHGRYVLHYPTTRPLIHASHFRHVPGVIAVSVQRRGPIKAIDRLALDFAVHLHHKRSDTKHTALEDTTPIVSARPDASAPSAIGLFHLIDVRTAMRIARTVVWEWIDRRTVEFAFNARLPDLSSLTPYLPTLIDIWRSAMAGTGTYSEDTHALVTALRGQPISGAFVLGHYNLVCRLLIERLGSEDADSGCGHKLVDPEDRATPIIAAALSYNGSRAASVGHAAPHDLIGPFGDSGWVMRKEAGT